MRLHDDGWLACPDGWQDRFAPKQEDDWLSMPLAADLLPWQSPGSNPSRTWVYSPDREVLSKRWDALVQAPAEAKAALFRESRDAHLDKVAPPLAGHPAKSHAFKDETGPCPHPVPVAFRAFDRQWLIPDARLLHAPSPALWRSHGPRQIYAFELHTEPIGRGPALIFSALPPDKHFFKGSGGGRAMPLYRDEQTTTPNLAPGLLSALTSLLGATITPEDALAYIAAVTSHSGYTERFAAELDTPGARVPLTADYALYQEAVVLGREVLWLHTYGTRCADPSSGRPSSAPRLPSQSRPKVAVAIPDDEAGMPETIEHDASTFTLKIGEGRIAPVPAAVFAYEVGGTNVLRKWFGYRKKKPAGKRTSPLDFVNPTSWSPDYTTDLLSLLNVLGRLVELEPQQADLLARVLAGPMITTTELTQAGVLPPPAASRKPVGGKTMVDAEQGTLI